jgi:prevent-host-death family protein
MKTWQLQEAKAKFSQVVEKAMKGEPQLVTKHGEKAVVVLDYEAYQRLEPKKAAFQGMSAWEALRKGAPMLSDEEIALFERDRTTTMRETGLEDLFQ